ncbi:deoxynucleoside triphosphate triphosphohydrolase SAMHD1-like [Strongylocentrotus purpuratus]|uniref:HD domain-containing protein n=1 Tax=Strongylocentrotus purpuratus TaxID=7668 RepID=A0A7M7PE12_STRPU|nr:deoxynucleoside triphosphate triphosphohydrolase SAMHD1-like [Strongylocentrotus purpuratus]
MNEKGEMKKEVEKKKCVSHLGGKLALMLQENDRNSSTPIQNTEVACVEIAGLCHDLGHGPFSHAFEDIIQPYEDGNKWKPDKQAVFMLKYLIKHNSLEKKLADLKIYAEDIDFICQLILGVKEDDEMLRENKFCLYQLVNNSVYGMDVDRWDYIARGAHYLHVGRKSTFDFKSILSSVKILDVKRGSKTRRELCFRDEVARDLNQMFLTSRQLNYASYQDRHSEVIAIMLKDAFKEAADHLVFVGEGGKKYKLLDSVKDPEAFCQVDDTIVNAIRQSLSQEPGMMKAREIIDRIHRREFYHCIAECKHAKEEMGTMDPAEIKREILTDVDELSSPSSSSSSEIWQAHNIEVISVKLSRFDCGGRNPLINIPFYKESSDGTFVAEFLPVDELQADLPPVDVSFRIYTKVPKLDRETVNMAKSRCETRLEMIHERQRSVPTKPVKQKVKSPPIGPVAPSPPLSAVGPVTSPSSGSGSFVSTDGDEGIPSLMSNPPDAVAAVGTGPAESNPRGSRSPEPEVKLH